MKKDQDAQVLFRFVKELKIPITYQSLNQEYQKHPNYGSLLALSDVLTNFKVPNSAYEVPAQQLSEVPVPYIAFMANQTFAVVTATHRSQVTLATGLSGSKKMTIKEFQTNYGNSILVAEKVPEAGEANYLQKRKSEQLGRLRQPIALTLLCALILTYVALHWSIFHLFGLPAFCFLLAKSIGLGVSILLLIQSIDADNPLISKLCGTDHDKNCNAVLSSGGAKIGGVSWSEVGFFYFSGTWLTLILCGKDGGVLQMLALFSLMTLPYTVYSLYYQWRIARQWCLFCCVIQAVFWLEFLSIAKLITDRLPLITFHTLSTVLICLTLPILLWVILKPYLLKIKDIEPLSQQLNTFKYNEELFNAMLKSQPKFVTPSDEWSITLGNVEANNVVTMISNPYCQPCGKAHAQLETALAEMADLQIRIVFAGDFTNETALKTQVHRHLMALHNLADKSIIKRALHSWYAQKRKDYATWAKEFPVEIKPITQRQLMAQMHWIAMVGVTATPTLMVNGRRLPDIYHIQDIKYML